MDALALLCNLHADGPTTLDELHRVGIRGLEDVTGAGPRGLVTELGWNDAAAERFVREANHLAARLGETLADPEEGTWAPVEPKTLLDDKKPKPEAAPTPVEPKASDEVQAIGEAISVFDDPVVPTRTDEREEEAATLNALAGTLERKTDELRAEELCDSTPRGGVDLVLRRWRELDDKTPPPAAQSTTGGAPAAGSHQPQIEGTPFSSEVIGALERGSVERLAEMGIASLEELVETPALALSRGLRTGFSRANRLQFLARRALEREAAVQVEEARAKVEAEALPSPAAPSTAGPFA